MLVRFTCILFKSTKLDTYKITVCDALPWFMNKRGKGFTPCLANTYAKF